MSALDREESCFGANPDETDAPHVAPVLDSKQLTVLSLVGFVAGVNTSSVNVVLSDLAQALGATTADLQWIVNSYVLTYAILLLTAATIGDRFGHVRMLRVGLGLAALSAASAAFSSSTSGLIISRATMGLAAAIVTPAGLATLSRLAASEATRNRAIGIWTGVASTGVAIGPIVGGVLLERFWWGSVFLVNVPVLLALLVGAGLMFADPPRRTSVPVDVAGLLLSMAGLFAIVWALIEGPVRGWLSAPIVGAAILGAALVGVLVVRLGRVAHPMLDVALLRQRAVAVPIVVVGCSVFALSGIMLALAILLRTVYGYGPLRTGLALAPLAAAMTLSSAWSSRLAARFGASRTIAGGLTLVTLACLLLALGAHSGFLAVMGPAVVLGLGHGFASAPATSLVVGAFPRHKVGAGSGLSSACRQIGMLMGIAVLGSVASSVYRLDLRRSVGERISERELSSAGESVSAALRTADRVVDSGAAVALRSAAFDAFAQGVRWSAIASTALVGVGLVLQLRSLRVDGNARSRDRVPFDPVL